MLIIGCLPAEGMELIIMTPHKEPLEMFEFIEEKDTYIDMKCTHCGYEEKLPSWLYGEEADFLLEEGDSTPPAWHCIKCHRDTLLRKP